MTLTKEGEGTVAISGADDLGAVVTGSKLTVTATPADGWEVSSITANGKDITTDKSFVVTSNTVVKVVFKKLPPKTYAVTLTKEGEGTVDISGADNLGAVVTGSKLTVTATPADGWEISSITANGRDITTDKSFVVTSNTTVKVVFKKQPPKTYKVTLVKEGEGTVAISGADNLDAVVTGSKLTVTATPADGWEVKSITANGKDITTDKSFVVTENTMVRAIFEEKALEICTYTIGLLKEGEGKVVVAPMKPVKPASLYGSGVPTIEIDPFEIDPSRINHVPCGVEVTLIATPADGWKLVSLEADGWDPLFGKSFSINRNTTVRATFTKKAPTTYAVTLTKEGEGTVAISGADNLGAVVTGSKLTVTAEPADGWEIGSITMNGKDITAEKSFVITSNTVVKVVFKKQPPKTYKVTLVQEGEGTVAILGANNLDSVEAGTRLKVKVNTDQIWKVVSMTANGIDILPNKSWKELVEAWLTVTSDIEIKVILKPSYEVEVFLDGRGKVTVPTPDGRVYTLQDKPNTSDEHQYILSAITRIAIGEKLTVTAEPAEGWKVARITANGVDITVSKTFTVTSDTKLRVFSLKKTSKTSKTYKVTVICSEGGSIELKRYNRAFERYEPIDLDRVPEGTALTVFSNPNEGYELSQCLFNGILRYGGVINEDTEVRAVFRPKY